VARVGGGLRLPEPRRERGHAGLVVDGLDKRHDSASLRADVAVDGLHRHTGRFGKGGDRGHGEFEATYAGLLADGK